MSHRLEGHVIVVTGATGIAAASAERLCSEGAAVFTISYTPDHCRELHQRLADQGYRHGWASADLRDEAKTVAAFEACVDQFGPLDGVLAVAGGSGRRFGDGRLDSISLDAWNATIELNLTTTFLTVRESIRRMLDPQSGGSVVIVSSVLADHPSPELFGTHAYAVAKGAQLALVRTASAAYAPDAIRINAIAPSLVVTPMSLRAQEDPVVTAYASRKQPLAGGFLDPGPVAAAAAYLLSSEASAVTGQVVAVDGGWGVTEAGS